MFSLILLLNQNKINPRSSKTFIQCCFRKYRNALDSTLANWNINKISPTNSGRQERKSKYEKKRARNKLFPKSLL